MGPSCDVVLIAEDQSALDEIDQLLAALSEHLERSPRGKVSAIWVRGRPVYVDIALRPVVSLAAGCNTADDYAVLRELSAAIIDKVGGTATEPEK